MRTLMSLGMTALVICTFAVLSIVATRPAQAAATAAAPATADIIEPISLILLDPAGLRFGAIIPLGGGTVTVAPNSARTFAGVDVVPSSVASAAHFKVGGHATSMFSIALPPATTIFSGANMLTVNAFTSTPVAVGTILPGGTNLDIGATLTVPAGTPVGTYVGNFNVTVAYN